MTPSLAIIARGHRPRIGISTRVTLSGVRVDPLTVEAIESLQDELSVKQGVLTDRMAKYIQCNRHQFIEWAKKEAASASTPHAASHKLTSAYQKPQRAVAGRVVNAKA